MSPTSSPLFGYPTLESLSTNLLVLSQPIHPLLPTIPLLLPLHAIRVAIAWEQIRSSKRSKGAKEEGLLKNLVGYLVMAFGGSTLLSLLLRTPPSWLTSPLLLPLYTLIYLLLPTHTLLLSFLPSLPLNFILSLFDAANRGLSITTLLNYPNLLHTAGPGATFFLAGLGTVGGGLLSSMFGLWEEEWTVQTPSLIKTLSFGEGLDGFIWGGMDFWSAGLIAILLPILLPSESSAPTNNHLDAFNLYFNLTSSPSLQWIASALGIQLQAQHLLLRKALAFTQKGDGEGEGGGWTKLEARTIATGVLGGLLGTRVLVLYARAWWKQVLEATGGKVSGEEVEEKKGGGEEVGEKVGSLVGEATTSSVDGPRKSGKAVRQRIKKRS